SSDLLALGGGRDQDRTGGGLLDQLLEDLGLGGDEVALDLGVVDHVDLLGAVLLEGVGRGVAGADEDGRRLTQAASDGEELEGRLLDRAVDVVDENQDFRHVQTPQMNFFEARNSASAV